MSEQTKIQAILDYGERLKMRSENDILYQKITTYVSIQIRNILLILIILYYFRHLILENRKETKKESFSQHMVPKFEQPYFNPMFESLTFNNSTRLLSPY